MLNAATPLTACCAYGVCPPAAFIPENQILAVDEAKVFCPPDKLHVPEAPSTNSDSAFSLQEDSDMSSSESSSAASSPEPTTQNNEAKDTEVWRCRWLAGDGWLVALLDEAVKLRTCALESYRPAHVKEPAAAKEEKSLGNKNKSLGVVSSLGLD